MAQKKFRLLMINPAIRQRYNWDLAELVGIMDKKTLNFPLALPLLAAITPEHWDITIIDDEFQEIPFLEQWDLVALTLLTVKAPRGYEIADLFLSRNISVVLGGPHVTLNEKEVEDHCSAMVIGEGEKSWPRLLKDLEAGELQKVYRQDSFCPFETSPLPRWDLVDTENVLNFNVQVSRGCPYRCDFCCVKQLFGDKHRYREIDNVLTELKTFPPGSVITFADDNLTANKSYIRKLLKEMIPLNLLWNCQASIDCAYDIELLKLMRASGCTSILIGFETLDPEELKRMNKPQNSLERYSEAINNIHAAGIHIMASFIVGLENDTPETFKTIHRFTMENNLCYVMVNALNAFHGTDFYKKMEQQDRLLDVGYDETGNALSNVRSPGITPVESFLGIMKLQNQIYSPKEVYHKTKRLLLNGAFTYSAPDVSTKIKVKTSFFFLFRYILSFNPYKKALFFLLIRGIKKNKVSALCIIQHLMFMESLKGASRYLKRFRRSQVKKLEVFE